MNPLIQHYKLSIKIINCVSKLKFEIKNGLHLYMYIHLFLYENEKN